MAMQKDMMSRAVRDSFAKLDPRVQVQNPVMFLVWLSAAMTSILAIASIFGVQDAGRPHVLCDRHCRRSLADRPLFKFCRMALAMRAAVRPSRLPARGEKGRRGPSHRVRRG